MPYADPQKHLERMREYAKTPDGKAAKLRANRAYRQRSKDRLAAHNAVGKALLRGHMTKWPCQVCGNANSEAHHPDYQNKLGVVWLCDDHHKEAHRVTKECDREAGRIKS